MYDARHGVDRPLYRSMRKYGIENFEFKVFIKNVPMDKLDFYECLWIQKLKTMDRAFGYNLTPGGMVARGKDNPMYGKTPWNKGIPRTDLEKQHIREGQAHLKEQMSKRMTGKNNPMYHHVYTESELKKLSDSVKGDKNGFYNKKHSEKTKQLLKEANADKSKAVDMIDAETCCIIKHFDSLHDAARYINDIRGTSNADKSFISRCASGKHKIAYGFKWAFSERCND